MMRRLDGDIMVLGIGGKIGHTLGGAAVRAINQAGVKKSVHGVDSFPEPGARERIEGLGVVPMTCDLLDPVAVAKLPRADNIIFMAGRKFGTSGDEELTWAINALVPAHVAAHFTASRVVAFSTGCVYPFVAPETGGSVESDAPAPVGEYAQSCLARERVFEYYSKKNGTPVCLFRLNYAIDLRYGVIHDIARRVWQGEPVDLTVGCFNCIWQGDAANQALLCLELCASPAAAINITGPETVSVRSVAEECARIMGKPVTFTGEEGATAYLSNAAKAAALFGPPRVPLAHMIRWTAEWIVAGGRSYDKPTHFEVTTGKY
ncbi:MAG: NAD(P)-dependent oxidoreductase [Armatimonadota bacterium]|nr:MAG: NAD(P)-dependent oxidoreductase [Armatimonadota bacterium]